MLSKNLFNKVCKIHFSQTTFKHLQKETEHKGVCFGSYGAIQTCNFLTKSPAFNKKDSDVTMARFVRQFMKTDWKEVKKRLGNRHPFQSRRVNIANACEILDFFEKQNVSREHLLNGIYVLLYDVNIVKKHFELTNSKQITEFTMQPYLVQMLLYSIEQNCYFSGNGVFMKVTSNEEVETKDIELNNEFLEGSSETFSLKSENIACSHL